MKTNILGVNFDTYDRKQALEQLIEFLKEDKNHILITPNPEIVLEAKKNEKLMKIINNADLVVPDGIGVVISSKLNKIKITERVAGYDLVLSLFNYIKDKNYTVYFLGSGIGVAEIAKTKIQEKYSGIKIVGTHNGYFDSSNENLIIDEIKSLKPDILLVGLGCPKQELWASKYKEILPVKLMCCCGGSLDAMAMKVKRAPDIFIKLNLEWFYRLIKQPSRFFRMLRLPLFMLLVLKNKIIK